MIVKDSAGKTAMGELEVTLLSANRYRVSVIAPQEFLNASDTFYPVYVDPTTTVYERENREFYDEEGDFSDAVFDTIIDVGLYESSSDVYWANQNPDSLILGDSFGLCRIIYKLYDFYGEHGYFTDLYAEQIGNVTLYLQTWDASPCTATVRPMNATWELSDYGENPVALCDPDEIWIWDNVSSNGSTTFTIEGDDTNAVDITQIARGWASYNRGQSTAAYHNPAYGFCVSADSASSYTYVYAANAAPWGDVYYEVDYSVYGGDEIYIASGVKDLYHFLEKGVQDEDDYQLSADVYTSTITSDIKYKLEYLGNNRYVIRLASDPTLALYDLVGYLYLRPYVASDVRFRWELDPSAGTTQIKSVSTGNYLYAYSNTSSVIPYLSSNKNGTPEAQWVLIDGDSFIPTSSNYSLETDYMEPGSSKYFQVLTYNVESAGMFYDWTLSSPHPFSITSDGKVTSPNFAGAYAYLTVTHRIISAEKTFLIANDIDINGSFVIQNQGTGTYMQVANGSAVEGAYIELGSYDDLSFEKWQITKNSDRTFTIKSLGSDLYLKNVASGSNNQLVQTSNLSYIKWRIVADESHFLYFVPWHDQTKAIVYDATGNSLELGTLDVSSVSQRWFLFQYDYSPNFSIVNYYDESFNESLLEHISDANAFVSEVFEPYGLNIQMDGNTVLRNDLTENCECDCENATHRDLGIVSERIDNTPREQNHIYVLWTNTDNNYCGNGNVKRLVMASAISIGGNDFPIIVFQNIEYMYFESPACYKAVMAIDLAHEVAHVFGVPDRTHEDEEELCIMKYFEDEFEIQELYEEITNGSRSPFCTNCHNALMSGMELMPYTVYQ